MDNREGILYLLKQMFLTVCLIFIKQASLTEVEVLDRIAMSKGKRARMQMLARKKNEKQLRQQALAKAAMEEKLKRRLEQQGMCCCFCFLMHRERKILQCAGDLMGAFLVLPLDFLLTVRYCFNLWTILHCLPDFFSPSHLFHLCIILLFTAFEQFNIHVTSVNSVRFCEVLFLCHVCFVAL